MIQAHRNHLRLGALLLLHACDNEPLPPAPSERPQPVETARPAPTFAPPLPSQARSSASASATVRSEQTCGPSLRHEGPLDPRHEAALQHCVRLPRIRKSSPACGSDAGKRFNAQRFIDAVPELSQATVALVRETFKRGQSKGRRPRVFGVLGDSISVSFDFLRGFESGRQASNNPRGYVLSSEVAKELGVGGTTVIDYFAGEVAERESGIGRSSFSAFRAAKVGARASYAFDAEERPLEQLLSRLNPAFVLVTFGANDAAFRRAPPEALADEFGGHLEAIIDRLLAEGVVPVISNEMRHGDQPGVKACPSDGEPNDWRIAVATNATTARAAEIACRRNLPFIDLRHALDGATGYGLGPDSVHLSTFKQGADVLDPSGLDCGNNIRNYVTLLGLARVLRALDLRP